MSSGTNVGSIILNLVAGNTSAFQKTVSTQANKAANSMSGTFSSAFKKIGTLAAAAFSVKAITAFSKECVNLASDLAEVQNVVDVTFGSDASKINDWAKTTANSVGVAELSAKRYSGTMGAMLKSMNIASGTALDMSMNITELAGDMASFYNLDTDTAFEKIRSGISGETEPLKQLGINMSVVNLEAFAMSKGITKSYQSMTQAEQATLRYNYLLHATADAQGDFSRTSDSWANQVRILKLNFDSLKASVGQLIINALTPLLKHLNSLIAYANKAASSLTQLFGGSSQSTAASTAGAMSGVSSSAVQAAEDITATGDTAAKTAKKIKGSFADIDEIHVLGQKEENESTGTGAFDMVQTGQTVPVETTESEKKIDSLVNKLGQLNKIDFSSLKASFGNLKDSFSKFSDIVGNGVSWVYENVLVPLAEWSIEEALPVVIDTLASAFDFLSSVLEALQPLGEWLWNNLLLPIAEWTGEAFTNALENINENLQLLSDLVSGEISFKEFCDSLSGLEIILGSLVTAIALVKGAQIAWNAIQIISTALAGGLSAAIGFITSPIGIAIAAITAIIAAGVLLYKNWDTVKAKVTELATKIKDAFASLWQKIKNVINSILGGIEKMVNGVIRGINKMTSAINALSFKIPDWVPTYGGKQLGFNIKQISEIAIPRLAQGGWLPANNPRLAIVGDNTREGEIVTPESKIREQVELAMKQFGGRVSDSQLGQIIKQAIKEVLAEFKDIFGGDWTIVIVDENGNEKGSTIITAAQRKNRRDGKTVIKLGV